jgi:hypothetical protein
VTAGPARLSGTLTIGDSVVIKPGILEFPITQASMQETLCSTGRPPCSSAGLQRAVDYTFAYEPMTVRSDSTGVSGALGSSYELLRFDNGTFAGDSIVGTLEWQAQLGVGAEIYNGTYVARRRR